MKKIALFLLFVCYTSLFSLTLVLNSAKENKEDYFILHIFDQKEFLCKKEVLSITQERYVCNFDLKNDLKLEPKRTKLVDISFQNDKNGTKITITPKYKIKVFKTSMPLYETNEVGRYRYKKAKHWIFILYKNELFLKPSKKDEGINFPVLFSKGNLPSVGALDLNGMPISYVGGSKDITAYLAIKDDFDKNRYRFVISEVDKAIKNYPNSIFLNDFMLYKIRALNKILQTDKEGDNQSQDESYEQIIKLGKEWIKKFPSNQNIPEVLYYIATAFQNLGQDSDAKYFYDMLITEHPNAKYTKLGIISFADNLYNKNKKLKAIELYKDVLYSTKDIQIASIAADRLGNIYLKLKDYKKSEEYFKKIIDANPDFYLKDQQKAYEFAMKLSRNKMEKLSVLLLEKLLKKIKRNPGLKGDVIKSLGDIYRKMGNKKMAFKYYKEYLNSFRYGQYADEIKKDLDGLFFDSDEKNSTKLLSHYDKLMKKYEEGNIYQKAGILKAKLLIKMKRYSEALDFLNNFNYDVKNKKIVTKLKREAAKFLAEKNLKSLNCLKAVELVDSYKISIDGNLSKNLAQCYIDTNSYDKAITVSQRELKKVKNAKEKYFWLKIQADAAYKKGDFKNLLMISNDLLTLGKSYGIKDYQKALYYKFFALFELKKYDEAINIANKIESIYPDDFRDTEVYNELVKYGKKIDDSTTVIKYSKEIIRLQNRYKSYPYSPKVELELILSLKKLKKYKEALAVAEELLKRAEDKKTKARVLYEMGDIYLKSQNSKKASEVFKECSKLDVKSGWVDLCKESLKLF